MISIFIRRQFVSVLLLFFVNAIYANANHFYVGGMLGPSFANVDKHPSITYYNGDLHDAYPINNNHQTGMMMGLNTGYEFAGLGCKPAIALGLGFYGNPSPFHFKGQLIETAAGDPAFLLYHYKFNARSTRLMAEANLSWIVKSFMPFINAGIGTAWNYAFGYSESVATPDGFVALPPFKAHTNTRFAYQVGFGLGYAFDWCPRAAFPRERISLGYRYVDAGNIAFVTRGAEYPHRLNLGSFKTNDVYLSYTHLF